MNRYMLLSNNCCYFSDHLLKVLTNKPLPNWVFSLAKAGDGSSLHLIFKKIVCNSSLQVTG